MVVISGFAGTPDDGHGHHQLAGFLTPLAFRQAGDPTRFPEHMAEGLRPWQPLKLYVSGGFGEEPAEGMLRIETGAFDPALGRSYFEIAMEGRSQHKSQDMGALELRGPRFSAVRLVESRVGSSGPEKHVLDGIDTSLPGIRQLLRLPAGLIDDSLVQAQDSVQKALADSIPWLRRVVGISRGLRAVRAARETFPNFPARCPSPVNAVFSFAARGSVLSDSERRGNRRRRSCRLGPLFGVKSMSVGLPPGLV
jgi:hypothetical protein